MITDHAFAELGLPVDASEQEVKAAWRRLVSQWHPDRNASAAAVAKVQRINQAFEAIRRARQQPEAMAEPVAPEPEPAAPPAADPGPQRPPIRRKIKLTLEEAAAGCIKPVRGKLTETCTTCDGAGHQVLGGNCASCGGSGAIQQRSAWFGWPSVRIECEACLGGGIARRTCPTCDGACKCEVSYEVQVRIPHGVRDGDLLHVDARRARAGSAPADLEIQVQIAPHALFQLHDDGTVRCEVRVNGFAWIANRTVQVPTLAGAQTLQLNRDLQTYLLQGQGFPKERRGARGDQVVTIVPVFPHKLSTDQDIMLDQLIAASSDAREAQPAAKARGRKRTTG
ncbi:DnaJ C-terminal domain-containing protein [Pseudorhodoferax sp. Leaf267]|uniref:DnaJ C-terminal domain-containing protein n=1 Tax=Pseudorhodoferax sp. Leaf267 TaxID=1736316 RepID=UPI0006F31A81|nr:DnaJ C-terminal domain-containing protein [Pseudorhodoferax sp. Leaf267]KQP17651.1 molecular chaperone DnaJ [Pseudorhodoferax sp. Leaf267]